MRDHDSEMRRLYDIMPASGRMWAKIVSKPEQSKIIIVNFPVPWQQYRPIFINFDLWRRLKIQERDLLILRYISWLINIKWFRPDLYQVMAVIGTGAGVFQGLQSDLVGVVLGLGLTGFAMRQIWQKNHSNEYELLADESALKVAERRGYNQQEAAKYLLSAMEAMALIEGRRELTFMELIRCQNLRAIAGISPLGVV
jgi:Protein of unknown function (DUF3318)